MNFQMLKLDLEKAEEKKKEEKAEEPGIKLPTSAGSWKKQENSRKKIFSFIDYAKAFECVHHNKMWKILKDGNTRPPDLPLEKSVCRSGTNS